MILTIALILSISSIINIIVTYRTGQWNALNTQNSNRIVSLENMELREKIKVLNHELKYLSKNKYKAYVISEFGIQVLPENWDKILKMDHLKEEKI